MTRTAPRHRPVRLLAAGLALLAGLALTGCDPVKAGAAAVVGDARITTADLQDTVTSITDAQADAGGGQTNAGDLQRQILTRKIVGVIVDEAAARRHVHVSRGEVDSRLDELAGGVGGRKKFEDAVLSDGVSPDELPGLVRQTITIEKLGRRLVPGQGQQAQLQRQQATGKMLTRIARDLGVSVNPRYGHWNPRTAQLAPDVNDLSRPGEGSGGPGGGQGAGAPGGAGAPQGG